MCVCVCVCWKDKWKKNTYFGVNENLLYLLCRYVFQLKFYLYARYSIEIYSKFNNNNNNYRKYIKHANRKVIYWANVFDFGNIYIYIYIYIYISIGYRSYGSQTWPIKWNAVSSKQRSCRYCRMDALHGC